MRIRLAGVPAPYTVASDLLVVDEAEHYYLLGEGTPALTPLTPEDAMSITGYYEPVESARWLRAADVIEALQAASEPVGGYPDPTADELLAAVP